MNHPKVLAEYKEIEEALRFEREVAETSFAALIKPRITKRVILGMSIQMWSQLCGMVRIVYPSECTWLTCEEYNDVLHSVHHARSWNRGRAPHRIDPVHYQRCDDSTGHHVP